MCFKSCFWRRRYYLSVFHAFTASFSSSQFFVYSLPEHAGQLWERLTRGQSTEQNRVQHLAFAPSLSLTLSPPSFLIDCLLCPPPLPSLSLEVCPSTSGEAELLTDSGSPFTPHLPPSSRALSLSLSLSRPVCVLAVVEVRSHTEEMLAADCGANSQRGASAWTYYQAYQGHHGSIFLYFSSSSSLIPLLK